MTAFEELAVHVAGDALREASLRRWVRRVMAGRTPDEVVVLAGAPRTGKSLFGRVLAGALGRSAVLVDGAVTMPPLVSPGLLVVLDGSTWRPEFHAVAERHHVLVCTNDVESLPVYGLVYEQSEPLPEEVARGVAELLERGEAREVVARWTSPRCGP